MQNLQFTGGSEVDSECSASESTTSTSVTMFCAFLEYAQFRNRASPLLAHFENILNGRNFAKKQPIWSQKISNHMFLSMGNSFLQLFG